MRFQATLCVGCCFIAIAAGRAQTPPPAAAKPNKSDVVIVRGCVTGRVIVTDPTTESITLPGPLRYDLTGSKEMMKALEAHSKHTEEITGKLKGDDAGGATRAVDERWGKNRVYAGRSDSTHDTLQIASGPKIEVTAFKHLYDNCR